MVCFDFLEQCRSASGTLVQAVQRSQAEVACILGISNPPLNGAAVPGLKCVWSRQVRIRFTNRRPISTASSSPQFDLVRHALDIATGIVEAP